MIKITIAFLGGILGINTPGHLSYKVS